MLYILFLTFVASVIAAFVYLSILNPATVDLHFSKDVSISMSVPEIMIFSFLTGMLFMALGTLFREGKRAIKNWKESRQFKRIQHSDELYHLGVEHLLKGKDSKAMDLFTRALEKNMGNIKAHLRLSEIHAARGEYPEAIKILNKGRQIDIENLEVLFTLADNYKAMGDTSSASEILKKILSLDETNLEALRRLRDVQEKGKKRESAYRTQKIVARISKGTPRYASERKALGHLKYGYAMELAEKGERDRAMKKLRDALKLDDKFVPAYIALGDLWLARGEKDKARETWEEAYKKLDHAIFLIRIEDMYLEEEDPEALVGFYHDLVESRPRDLIARLFFAKLCLRLEMIDEAQEQLSSIESQGGATFIFHQLRGEIHMRRQRFDEAAEEFRRAAGVGKAFIIPFFCSHCQKEFPTYAPQCPSCQRWGTFLIKEQETSPTLPPSRRREETTLSGV